MNVDDYKYRHLAEAFSYSLDQATNSTYNMYGISMKPRGPGMSTASVVVHAWQSAIKEFLSRQSIEANDLEMYINPIGKNILLTFSCSSNECASEVQSIIGHFNFEGVRVVKPS